MNTRKQLWLSPKVLSWRPSVEESAVLSEKWKRSYDIWAHAEQILQRNTTDFERIDAITTLKRVVDNRIKLLNDIYKFKNIPLKDKFSEKLEILEYLGIIRPIMLQRLIDIRNAVEHEDASPPEQNECLSFLEFVWYFLRSTDHLVREIIIAFVFYPHSDNLLGRYVVEIRMSTANMWNLKVGGWVEPYMISEKCVNNWILINVEQTGTRASILYRLGEPDELDDIGRGKDPDDVYLQGEIRGPAEHLKRILLIYFEAI